MAIKRALVVDDSRSARVALKQLLEANDLDVALAESGEAALDFLKREMVDVIFMDHTMPGMDGLEAVSSIKANPKTATIPVMMYTTKEGEVYVGQARALGAMGVLPKNVQPHQLFEMLLKLGLVKDRRAEQQQEEVVHAYEVDEALDAVDHELDSQVVGMSVQALVTRILEDQHMTLRSDILRSQKEFARDVAREVLVEQSRIQVSEDESNGTDAESIGAAGDTSTGGSWILRAAGFAVLAVCAFLTWQFKDQRDAALDRVGVYEEQISAHRQRADERLRATLHSASGEVAGIQDNAIQALKWAVNLETEASLNTDAFDDILAEKIQSLVAHLQGMDFTGEVRLISHLGRFCLMTDAAGTYRLAPPDTPVLDCDHTGHRLEASSYVSDRLSVEFSQLMRGPIDDAIELNLIALDGAASQDVVAYPSTSATAGEWNAAARRNNRVQIDIIPTS